MPDGTMGASVRIVRSLAAASPVGLPGSEGDWVLPGFFPYTGTEGAACVRVLKFLQGSVFCYGFGRG